MDTELKINITDLQLRNLAEHIPPEKCADLGLSLGLTKTDLSKIDREVGESIERTFRVLDRWRSNLDPFLIRWRNKVDGRQTERHKLATAMRERGLEPYLPCVDAHVTLKESETKDLHPTINLSLPNGAKDADRKQEIDIVATFSGTTDDVTAEQHRQMYRLISHPTDPDKNWVRIRRIRSVFEPNSRLSNIEMLPICFTVDVASLNNLHNLRRSIEDESLATALLDVLDFDERGTLEKKGFQLKLELDMTSFNEGERFFKDLDPTLSSFSNSSRHLADDSATARFPATEGFDAWMSSAHEKPESELLDISQQQAGPAVNLVWRNVSQHNFGF